jgi:hypothetical protein
MDLGTVIGGKQKGSLAPLQHWLGRPAEVSPFGEANLFFAAVLLTRHSTYSRTTALAHRVSFTLSMSRPLQETASQVGQRST